MSTALFSTADIGPATLALLVALCGALAGLWLTDAGRHARLAVSFSAGLLVGISVFGLLPELVSDIGWPGSSLLFACGYLLLGAVDRYVYPVCPACSQTHDHKTCTTLLHGFAVPMVVATGLHAFLDGWSMAAAQSSAEPGVRLALPLAIVLHKIPEGVALGAIVRASLGSRLEAFTWCFIAEATTLAGAALGMTMAPPMGAAWINYPLAMAAGWFFYLGFHAVHGEWKRRGAPAFVPALTGAAGAAVLQQGVRELFR